MKVIKEIAVVVQSSSEHFHDELMNTTQRFQEQGLEVTINNPRSSRDLARVDGTFNYMAVVEGRAGEVDPNDLDDPHPFAPFNTIPNRRI